MSDLSVKILRVDNAQRFPIILIRAFGRCSICRSQGPFEPSSAKTTAFCSSGKGAIVSDDDVKKMLITHHPREKCWKRIFWFQIPRPYGIRKKKIPRIGSTHARERARAQTSLDEGKINWLEKLLDLNWRASTFQLKCNTKCYLMRNHNMESVLMAIELKFIFSGHGSSMVSPMHKHRLSVTMPIWIAFAWQRKNKLIICWCRNDANWRWHRFLSVPLCRPPARAATSRVHRTRPHHKFRMDKPQLVMECSQQFYHSAHSSTRPAT